MKKLISFTLLLLMLCSIVTGCDFLPSKNVYPITSTRFMMDTVVTLTIYDGDSDVLNGAMELCKKYDQMFSRTVNSSDVYKINNQGGTVTVNEETAELIAFALELGQKSDGAFDIRLLPLSLLWNVTENKTVPKKDKIDEALTKSKSSLIKVDGNLVTVSEGTQIDLGGVAKGYIADKVCKYFKEKGIKNAVINLGGNVYMLGSKKGKPYSVGLQKPFGTNGELSATVKIKDKTAVTSGIYQRYFKTDNKIYHHIIDPKTGYPVNNEIASVTVITDSSMVADGLSTAVLVLGKEKGTSLAKAYGAELIFIDKDGKITLTDGLYESNKEDKIIEQK